MAALELAVLLLVLALFAEALSVAAEDFTLLACCALLAVEDLEVESAVFALLDEEDMFVADALLLAFALSDALLLAVALSVELLVLVLLSL